MATALSNMTRLKSSGGDKICNYYKFLKTKRSISTIANFKIKSVFLLAGTHCKLMRHGVTVSSSKQIHTHLHSTQKIRALKTTQPCQPAASFLRTGNSGTHTHTKSSYRYINGVLIGCFVVKYKQQLIIYPTTSVGLLRRKIQPQECIGNG